MASSKPEKSSPKASTPAPEKKPVAKADPAQEEPAAKVKAAPANGEKKKGADPRTSNSVNAPLVDHLAMSGKQTPFLLKQRERLLALRDNILDSMNGVAKDTLRSRAEGSEASAFGMHQADAGSDAYDKDFALSLLSQEQDALYEIEEALKRIDAGTYGVCERCRRAIPRERLRVRPAASRCIVCASS